MGPDLFYANKQAVAWDDNIQSDLFAFFHYPKPEAKWDEISLRATYENLKKYNDAVILFKTLATNGNFTTTQLKEIINKNFVCCNSYKYLFKAPFTQLSSGQRNNILNVFLNDTWVLGRKSIGSDLENEDIILNTITTIKDESQHKDILKYLNDHKLLYKFVKNVDGDNYESITTTLTTWILEEFPPENFNLVTSIKKKQLLHFDDDYLGRRNTEDILQNNKIVLLVKKWSGSTEYQVICDPYDYIEVTFQNNFSIGSGNSAASFAKNTPYKLPALYVYLLFNADTKSKWMTSGKIVLDVAQGVIILDHHKIKQIYLFILDKV